jgi:tyrosinase
MNVEISINKSVADNASYVNWSPSFCTIRVTDPAGATDPAKVTLRNSNSTQGGQIVFIDIATKQEFDQIDLDLPLNGTPVSFFTAGKFGFPSKEDKDAVIEVIDRSTAGVIHSKPLMVRVRKNANTLTASERDRFLNALSNLNTTGRFDNFRNMHLNTTAAEAHGRPGFLPWHRAYLLDLERELQTIDASVSLPYWRFDQPAPNLFTREFIGVPGSTGNVRFTSSNPLRLWRTDGVLGIVRNPFFSTSTARAFGINEGNTIRLGDTYSSFLSMESNPHGRAHTSFGGYISQIGTAARDPLFFLLHSNVDRLWAKWQWFNKRFDSGNADTYPLTPTRVGHNLQDTMWPWNGITTPPRPSTSPGGSFPNSVIIVSPGPTPTVSNMIDFQGTLNPNNNLAFDYDDVPFE